MTAANAASQQPIAIVGVSALFPGSTDATGFWRDILEGRDRITDVPPGHWLVEDYFDADPAAPDKTYARRGGFLDPVGFDALGFGVPPSTLPATDTAQLLALILAQSVLQDAAREQFEGMDRSRISVILGVTSAQELLFSMVSRLQKPVWVKALRESGLPEDEVQAACTRIADHYVPWQESSFPGLLGNVVAGRIANRLNLGGTNCVTDAACASALSALSMAINELQLGHSDMVIAGGVDTLNDIFMYMCFSKTPALSPSGDCRPFSDQADGTMLGEGLGMFALKRLGDAERDGDRIYAVIRGLGSSSDGRSKSVYAPVPEGQAQALRRAYEIAGYGPDSVELMEAHGTGTKAGDAAEFEGLRQVFGAAASGRRQWCALGSVKSQIGHTKAAAGAAGLFKAVMALHHKVLPPGIKIAAPNPKLDIENSPFYLSTRARPWIRSSDHPRRASVSAFGFGGSNFHVTLEEYQGAAPKAERLPVHAHELLLLSADSALALAAAARALATRGEPLGRLARESQRQFRSSAASRLALVAGNVSQLRERLLAAAKRIEAAPDAPFSLPDRSSYGCGQVAGKLALLFPGQGSQYPGMGADLAMHFPLARALWDRAADLPFETGQRLDQRAFPPPGFGTESEQQDSAALTATEWAQPAIGATALSMFGLLRDCGIRADLLGGHSFGEVVALHAAGVLSDVDTLVVARRRGELMAKAASTPGAMTALALPVEQVRDLIERSGAAVVIANHNAPQQVVVSGSVTAIELFEEQLAAAQHGFRRLPVASAFHSPLVAGCCAPFAEFLAGIDFAAAQRPVFSNASGAPLGTDSATLRHMLAAQIAQPVRFVEMIEAMYADGARTFLEVGPGSVLTGLVGAILGARPHSAISVDRKQKNGVESLLLALARLAASGVPLDASRLFKDVREPPAAPAHGRPLTPISGSNVGKPYPPAGGFAALPAPNPPRAVAPPPALSEPLVSHPTAIAPTSAESTAAPLPPVVAAPIQLMANVDSAAWLGAFQSSQQQLADAHASFQRSMFETHATFLQLGESALAGLAAFAGDQARVAGAPTDRPPAPLQMPMPTSAPTQAAPPQAMPAAPVWVTPASAPAPTSRAPVDAQPAAVQRAARQVTPGFDLTALMLQIVAEKTGYPVDMLTLDMDLEGDLGIDSIKRVEILAAVDQRAPGLPALDRSVMSALHTLAEIVDYLQGEQGPAQPATRPTTPAVKPTTPAVSAPAAAADAGVDLTALMLQVVAEKTGYPVDMLNLDMDLEGDLGIDSIKRVEILAAVEARASGLPKRERSEMSALHTLAEIVAYLGGAGSDPPDIAPTATARPESTATPVPTPAAPALGRYRLQQVAAPAVGMAQPGLRDGEPLWIVGETAIGGALADELRRRGVDARCVDALPDAARLCVYLGGLREVEDTDQAIAINREAFALARQLAQRLESESGLLVTVQDTGGSVGLGPFDSCRAWLAGLPALVKTAALEWPRAALKAIDLDRGGRSAGGIATAIADELLAGGGEIEVMLGADGERATLCSVAAPVSTGVPVIVDGDVVLVSGGARGVTAACIARWAAVCRARFVLLGRTVLTDEPACCSGITDDADLKRVLLEQARAEQRSLSPSGLLAAVREVQAGREVRATLAAIGAAGASARYAALDVANPDALSALLAEVRAAWGPIRGVVHAAGVLADKRIGEKTDAMFDRVFDTKVGGLRALLDATRDDPLTLLAVFSSVSARCGNTGQADYAMANEVLAKVTAAEARRRPGLFARSFGWGPWEAGMVTPQLRDRFAALGVPMIGLAVGAQMFVDELSNAADPSVELVLGGEPRAEALLFEGSAARVQSLQIDVARSSHAYLEGHAIHGQPVLPLVLAAEWLSRAARSFRPGLPLAAVHDLKVLKGIRLGGFENGGDRFTIEASTLPSACGAQLQMRILDRLGQPNYSARIALLSEQASPQHDNAALTLEPWGDAPIYQDLLFHRGAFELIDQLDGISDHGIEGRLRGVTHGGWEGEDWQLDVAALDGGLQLAVLFGHRMLGGPNLPTGIDQIRAFGLPPGSGFLSATAYRRALSTHAMTTDIVFKDAQGQRVAELLGVHNHALGA